ncbi:flavin-binding monooxygenase-like family protein [Rhizodiscina lignyota]|uniref:Flavin-binding monooxygenase-like family protein n=1 Tax=Rhizodiscina lignyota TaxID=1504668 RepID=A0A9P4I9U2_9PEZI|nr:flavin-binding monooxygenase-like family protein [Rhizodiscina lignyota]
MKAGVEAAAAEIQQKYANEREKRLRPEGDAQYIDLSKSDKFKHFQEDPWVDPKAAQAEVPDYCKYLIVGAGFGGLLFAVRLIEAGIPASDIRLVDSAGGFGGTWYWNRYPGLMCDVESYIYAPLLEEMGYMPKHRYSYGPELREYAESIVAKWDLKDKAIFRQLVKSATWDNDHEEWVVETESVGAQGSQHNIRAPFVILASGLLNYPKLPGIPGIENFQGHSFHTSRWDYAYTGGSPTDPSLVNLRDKTVGIIGTGATAVQAVPHLAQWAKKLYVFQRTPSSVDTRDNHPTDPQEWQNKITKRGKGWQRERSDNFNARLAHASPETEVDMVSDSWSKISTYCALIGNASEVRPEDIPTYVASLHAQDFVRAERIRARVENIVKDKDTAERLKHWYPTWCKRPTFHDEYLQTYNNPNVKLIDTEGRGVDRATEKGLVVGDKEFDLDVLIFSTGFASPSTGNGSPALRAGIEIKGRDGADLDKRTREAPGTLHGVISRGFPNLFWPGPLQAGVAANQMYVLDQLSTHIAYILAKAAAGVDAKNKVIIEPTAEAEDQWGLRIMSMAARGAAMKGCTPSYMNSEGGLDQIFELPVEIQMQVARVGVWGKGILDYVSVLEQWRAEGKLSGLEVSVAH